MCSAGEPNLKYYEVT